MTGRSVDIPKDSTAFVSWSMKLCVSSARCELSRCVAKHCDQPNDLNIADSLEFWPWTEVTFSLRLFVLPYQRQTRAGAGVGGGWGRGDGGVQGGEMLIQHGSAVNQLRLISATCPPKCIAPTRCQSITGSLSCGGLGGGAGGGG